MVVNTLPCSSACLSRACPLLHRSSCISFSVHINPIKSRIAKSGRMPLSRVFTVRWTSGIPSVLKVGSLIIAALDLLLSPKSTSIQRKHHSLQILALWLSWSHQNQLWQRPCPPGSGRHSWVAFHLLALAALNCFFVWMLCQRTSEATFSVTGNSSWRLLAYAGFDLAFGLGN